MAGYTRHLVIKCGGGCNPPYLLDSRFRGNDGCYLRRIKKTNSPFSSKEDSSALPVFSQKTIKSSGAPLSVAMSFITSPLAIFDNAFFARKMGKGHANWRASTSTLNSTLTCYTVGNPALRHATMPPCMLYTSANPLDAAKNAAWAERPPIWQ